HYYFALLYYLVLLLFIATAPTYFYTLSLHDALPICVRHHEVDRGGIAGFHRGHRLKDDGRSRRVPGNQPNEHRRRESVSPRGVRSEEHTSELQSRGHLVCRRLLEKKKRTLTGCRVS